MTVDPLMQAGTHLGPLDAPLLEGAGARVVGAVMAVLAPVALVGAAHTGQAPGGQTAHYTTDGDSSG